MIRSDGSLIRDYFYIEDGASAYMDLAEALASRADLKGEGFNFSTEIQMTVKELAQRILELMDSDLSLDIRDEVKNEIAHQYLDATKAKTMLGWGSRFSMDEALSRTIAWYREAVQEAP